MTDGAETKIRRYANTGKPCLILSHGNGFAIDAYAPFWEPLRDNFELCLYDQRHHGWNDPAPSTKTGFELFADDFKHIIKNLRETYTNVQIYGVFHSLSAVASLLHAITHKQKPDALILFDPPLQPPKNHELYGLAQDFEIMLSKWSQSRRSEFQSPEELAQQFMKSKSLSGWIPGSHELMAKSILKQRNGKWFLICPPSVESQIYLDNANLIIWESLSEIDIPIAIINADPKHPAGQAPAQICAELAKTFSIRTRMIEGTTHLLQIEKPQECRDALLDLLGELINS